MSPNPSNELDPKLLAILIYLLLATMACVFTYHYIQPIPGLSAAGVTPSRIVSSRAAIRWTPVLHLMSWVLCFCLLGFVVYSYRVRARHLPGKIWPLGLACLCVGLGMLISLFFVF